MILRARNVLPITAPPIEKRRGFISGNQIRRRFVSNLKSECSSERNFRFGRSSFLASRLVNAHWPLDYTDMAGLWSAPKKLYRLDSANARRQSRVELHRLCAFVAQRRKNVLQTAQRRSPTSKPCRNCAEMWDATPLRIFSFLEMTGIRSKRGPRDI